MLYIVTTSKANEIEKSLGQIIKDSQIPHQLVTYENCNSIPAPDIGGVVFILGAKAWKGVGERGVVKKNLTYTGHRGLAIPWGDGFITPGPDPFAASMDHKADIELKLDCAGAIRLHNTGTLMPEVGKYRYVDDLTEFCDSVQSISHSTGKPVPVAVDLETVGLDEWNPDKHIVCIQLSYREGFSDIVYFDGPQNQPTACPPWEHPETTLEMVWAQLEWLLTTPMVRVRGANLKFDLRWMRKKWGIEATNYSMDTTLVGSLIDENRSNSLNTHAKWYTPMGGYDDPFNRLYDKSRMDLIPKEDMKIYAGGDTDACLQVSNRMVGELTNQPGLHNFYSKLLHPANAEMVNMEMEGVLIDRERFDELGHDLTVEIARLQAEAEKLMPGRLVAKMGAKGLKLSRPAVIAGFMFSDAGLNLKPLEMTASGKGPSTAYTHLIKFQDNETAAEFIDIYKQFNSATKTLSTYVTGFLKHLRSDGRFHATYILYKGDHDGGESGTNTGRLACKEPAMQCMTGTTRVLTDQGPKLFKNVISDFEHGMPIRVLTHFGTWMPVTDVYRNGVKPIYRITTETGREIDCTGNHPLLVDGEGFVRADELQAGDDIYGTLQHQARPAKQGEDEPRILFVGGDEKPMHQHVLKGLGKLRGAGHRVDFAVDDLRGFLRRHGGEANGDNTGAEERQWPLHTRELYLGDQDRTGEQPAQQPEPRMEGEDPERSQMGARVRPDAGVPTIPAGRGIDFGRGVDAPTCFVQARAAGFQKDRIVSITTRPPEETFDITVYGAHSFVAEGVVVHNTLPKHTKWAKRLRECYVAPPGHLMFEVDFSQGELRVTACVANEPTMLESYHKEMDLHIVAGAMACGIPIETALALQGTKDQIILPSGTKADFKFIRQNGKAANFGLIYGMGAEGYVSYARDSYGVKMSIDQAWDIRSGFFGLYDRLENWHKVYKAFAHQHGYVVSPLGRIRHLPNINHYSNSLKALDERRAINAPIQSTLSDMTLLALVELRRRYGHNIPLKPCMAVHDAILGYVPVEDVHWVHRLVEVMETLPLEQVFGWKPQITFTAEPEVGPDLGHLKELHLPT